MKVLSNIVATHLLVDNGAVLVDGHWKCVLQLSGNSIFCDLDISSSDDGKVVEVSAVAAGTTYSVKLFS
eukprot:15358351-Ditylum_brightwellii.AAC.1